MNNNLVRTNEYLDKINEIMKPYFDDEKNFKELLSQNTEDNKVRLNVLNLKLEKLRDNKEREIAEYIEQLYLDNPNVSQVYVSMIKRDLEQAYKVEEDKIKEEIDSLSVIKLKDGLVNNLLQYKEQLELEQKEVQINFDEALLNIEKFKYSYGNDHIPTNGNEFKALWEKSEEYKEQSIKLKDALDQIDKYLKMLNVSKSDIDTLKIEDSNVNEETKEIEEVNNVDEKIKEVEEVNNSNEEIKEAEEDNNVNEETKEELSIEKRAEQIVDEITADVDNYVDTDAYEEAEKLKKRMKKERLDKEVVEAPEDLIDSYDKVYAERYRWPKKTVVKNYDNLIKTIYLEVCNVAKNLDSVKLDPIAGPEDDERVNNNYYISQKYKTGRYNFKGSVNLNGDNPVRLPNGEYLNEEDFTKALDKYYKQNKNRTFVVKGIIRKSFVLDLNSIKALRNNLKKCSTVKLLSDNKITNTDVLRVYGKEDGNDQEFSQIGSINSKLEQGDYISKNQLIEELGEVFISKRKKWLKEFTSAIKDIFSSKEDLNDQDSNENFVHLDEEEKSNSKRIH